MSVDAFQSFIDSWRSANTYPLNLIKLGSNTGSLRALKTLIDANATNLFRSESKVITLDFVKDGERKGISIRNPGFDFIINLPQDLWQ